VWSGLKESGHVERIRVEGLDNTLKREDDLDCDTWVVYTEAVGNE